MTHPTEHNAASPGCKNCYSSRFQPRLGLPVFQDQRRDPPELFLDGKTLLSVLRRRKPTKYFWCDMTDMFGEWVPDEWIAACFGAMAATPWHTHQVLTKRPERARKWFELLPMDPFWDLAGNLDEAISKSVAVTSKIAEKIYGHFEPTLGEAKLTWPLPNVWLGTSVENQEAADKRIPELLRCPAAVRFLSCEPLLGSLQLNVSRTPGADLLFHSGARELRRNAQPIEIKEDSLFIANRTRAPRGPRAGQAGVSGIDWVIIGGESGPAARPCDVAWIRSIRDQCKAAGVACFVKQLGAKPMQSPAHALRHLRGSDASRAVGTYPGAAREMLTPAPMRLNDRKGGDPSEWPEDLRVREFPEAQANG